MEPTEAEIVDALTDQINRGRGEMTYVIRNVIAGKRKDWSLTTDMVRRKLKRLERGGRVRRVPSNYVTQICWQLVEEPVLNDDPAQECGVREALAPVLDWYQSDELPDRETADIVRDAVADLQEDREQVMAVQRIAQDARRQCAEGAALQASDLAEDILRTLGVGQMAGQKS